ncbi:PAS domain-containing sensor histidine kinase [Anoxybacillus ayderensis]|uniref:two-component system sensor histidine kinase NtrB n=1 Tax=Anoxybacillus sp. ST70 TaxID=2864180 RepID=UPI00030B4880|nr:ATP-binding protein [Anoxybacillus sp. ST70]AXM90323.1 PAS domain-containing sensor histidine kinase [Anoxybacillus ayderensis G10]MBW9218732.1 PAS domain-containing protein [Anoxybacillus sp. ST70]THD17494.1 PAS domain-containing sensor histidine kinase [Anoxybacillus ayderensis]
MESHEQLKQKINELEEEIRLYKRFVEHISFPFSYVDYELGKIIKKERNIPSPTVETIEKEKNKTSILQWNIDLQKDYPFEQVEQFLSPIFDLVSHHIVFVDAEGKITLCNLQAANDVGVNRDEMIGKHIRELLNIPDEQIMTLKTLRTKQPLYNCEVLDRYYGIINTRILYNEDGSIKRVISMFQSLNQIKEAEKLAIAGRIAAGIAHEIRNPLTTVRGYLQFLKEQLPKHIVTLIDQLLIPELDRANDIITDFLNVAKPSEVKAEWIGINEFIRHDLDLLLRSEALLHNVELSYHLDEKLQRYVVNIDKNQLLQVFINLFRNAIEAKTEKSLRVDIETKLHNNLVQIYVRDNGPGIPSTIIHHVFDPFFSTKPTGTGLGLSLSRKIIELHKGSMRVQSEFGNGSCFIIELPAYLKK